jgi:hypothetical protein
MAPYGPEVFSADHFGQYVDLLGALAVLEHHGFVECKIQLLAIQYVKDYYFVTGKSQMLEAAQQFVPLNVQVGYQHYDASPLDKLGAPMQLVHQGRASRSGEPLQDSEHGPQLARPRTGRQVLDHSFVECGESDGIVLSDAEIRQRRSQILGVLQLAYPGTGKTHRGARIDQQVNLGVSVSLVLLDVHSISSGEQLPIEVPDIIPRHVLAMLSEIRRETQIRGAVQTGNESLHHCSSDKLERVDTGQHVG